MNIPEVFREFTFKRKKLSSQLMNFHKKLPLEHNKKSRISINNSGHWTSPYFKARGVLTVSETVFSVLDFVYSNCLSTKEKAQTFVAKTLSLIPDLCLVAMFLLSAYVGVKDDFHKTVNDDRYRQSRPRRKSR